MQKKELFLISKGDLEGGVRHRQVHNRKESSLQGFLLEPMGRRLALQAAETSRSPAREG